MRGNSMALLILALGVICVALAVYYIIRGRRPARVQRHAHR